MTREEINQKLAELKERLDTINKTMPEFDLETEEGWEQQSKWLKENIYPLDKENDRLISQLRRLDRLEVKVGDGITISCWTDGYAYTVISRTAKTITIQRDNHKLIEGSCQSEFQIYEYSPNPNGEIKTLYWSDKKGTWVSGSYIGYLGRHEYYDPCF